MYYTDLCLSTCLLIYGSFALSIPCVYLLLEIIMISYQYLLWLLYGYIVVVYHKKFVIVCYSMTIQPLS